jgi:hypothetical protein
LEQLVAAVRWRRGELLGGDEGEKLLEEGRQYLSNQGVKNPAQMVTMLAPGRWS